MGGQLGDNLIFLISQPRAGSTLLQEILGAHPEIHTLEEPWFLLPLFYGARHLEAPMDYDAKTAESAIRHFLSTLPNGNEAYYVGVGRMGEYIYGQALLASGKRFFLDKTPRYYFIIPEIARAFPGAKIILLLRNPLAVLASMINTWTIFMLYRFRQDILHAPNLLASAINDLQERVVVVHFEDLISNPHKTVEQLCARLGISFVPEIIEYGHSGNVKKRLTGDKENVDKFTRPEAKKQDEWENALREPQVLRLMRDYLNALPPKTLAVLGYDHQELTNTLKPQKAGLFGARLALPLSWVLKSPQNYYSPLRSYLARFSKSLKRLGWRKTLTKVSDYYRSSNYNK